MCVCVCVFSSPVVASFHLYAVFSILCNHGRSHSIPMSIDNSKNVNRRKNSYKTAQMTNNWKNVHHYKWRKGEKMAKNKCMMAYGKSSHATEALESSPYFCICPTQANPSNNWTKHTVHIFEHIGELYRHKYAHGMVVVRARNVKWSRRIRCYMQDEHIL